MNEQNTNKLYKDFDELYFERNLSIQESCMPWGFEFNDGWNKLVYSMSKELVKCCKKLKIPTIRITQIKERDGWLRVYWKFAPNTNSDKSYNYVNKRIKKIINKYCKKSLTTCEICGKKGKIRYDIGWYQCLCNKHYKEEIK